MKLEYEIKRSSRKTLAIHITPEGRVEVRCPMTMPKVTPNNAQRKFCKSSTMPKAAIRFSSIGVPLS